jgi:predicted nucleic acid-binding protein
MRVYLDSDVLIWHLRGDKKAHRFLRELFGNPEYEPWTGALQRAEIVFFMRPGEEEATLLLLSQLKTAILDQETVDAASVLYRKWNPGFGTDVNDAVLAATAMKSGGIIYCLNKKHYPMPEIMVRKAW